MNNQPATTPPRTVSVSPFHGMLRAGLTASSIAYPVLVVVFAIFRGGSGAVAAVLGGLIAGVFFAGGLMVMNRLVKPSEPLSFMVAALAVYLGQVIFLGLVIIVFATQSWLDGVAFGLTILAVTLIWQVAQVIAFQRTRRPVYELTEETLA